MTDEELQSAARETAEGTGALRYSNQQLRRAREVLTRLYAARRAARFYPEEHPAFREAVGLLGDVVGQFHGEGVDVQLAFYEGEILMGEQLLTEESVLFDQLVRDMTAIGAGSVIVRRGASPEELQALVALLATDVEAVDAAGGIEALSRSRGLSKVEVTTVRAVERVGNQEGEPGEAAKAAYGGAVSLLREFDRLLRANRLTTPGKVKGVVRSLVDNVLTNRYAMLQLTGLKNYDEYTYYHSANVAILSLALGSAITRDYRFLSSLGVGALLHDVGKLAVDAEIINKPGALTSAEWEEMRQHPVRGAQMVSLLRGVDKSAVVVILEHHMRYDGTGYPPRYPARRQHLASRIVAVADSYDAMTSRRSYSAARVPDEAMATLVEGGGGSLDPRLVRLFVRLLGVYPPRSLVRLTSGDIGIVLQPSPVDPLRPLVRVIASETGAVKEPIDIDLHVEGADLAVQGCIDPRLVNFDADAYL